MVSGSRSAPTAARSRSSAAFEGSDPRYEPALFSEHLAWSSHDVGFLNDLLPVPYTMKTLTRVSEHIDEVQDILGRQVLLEKPSTYLAFAESTWLEVDFIAEIVSRTGCGLLLDVSNVQVASTNHEWDPFAYIDAYPLHAVREIHLAGFEPEADEKGRPLLIDTPIARGPPRLGSLRPTRSPGSDRSPPSSSGMPTCGMVEAQGGGGPNAPKG